MINWCNKTNDHLIWFENHSRDRLLHTQHPCKYQTNTFFCSAISWISLQYALNRCVKQQELGNYNAHIGAHIVLINTLNSKTLTTSTQREFRYLFPVFMARVKGIWRSARGIHCMILLREEEWKIWVFLPEWQHYEVLRLDINALFCYSIQKL